MSFLCSLLKAGISKNLCGTPSIRLRDFLYLLAYKHSINISFYLCPRFYHFPSCASSLLLSDFFQAKTQLYLCGAGPCREYTADLSLHPSALSMSVWGFAAGLISSHGHRNFLRMSVSLTGGQWNLQGHLYVVDTRHFPVRKTQRQSCRPTFGSRNEERQFLPTTLDRILCNKK